MKENNFQKLLLVVQAAAVFLFLGRGWQHLFWDAPYRDLLWDERWMKGIIETVFGITWENYITSSVVDNNIQGFIKALGWFYFLCAFFAVFIQKWKKVSGIFMVLGSVSLVILAALYCKEKFFSIGQFFEYSIQFSTPVLLFLMVKNGGLNDKMLLFLKITIALTFVCHGLYAINYYPRPGDFIDMTLTILGISEKSAIQFLTVAGFLDFAIGIGVFLPFKYSKYFLIYAMLWGFATTFARIWANVYFDFFWDSLHQWWYEAAYRVPHFLIPLVLFLFYYKKSIPSDNL